MTAHNQTQLPTTRTLPGMAVGESKPMQMADKKLLAKCHNRLDAIVLCAQLSGFAFEVIARQCGIDKGNFTRMMQGRANLPDAKSILFMEVCGNYAPLQYEANRMGFELLDRRLLAGLQQQEAA